MKIEDKIIIALDTDFLKAKSLVKNLWPRCKFFKIGLEIINTGKAPELIKFINNLGGKVFYDAKLNDIPNTIGRAVKVISSLGVWGLTIHASSGREAIKSAVANKGKMRIIGVTALTSLKSSGNKVVQYAKILAKEGADGFVCSAREAKTLKKFKKLIITPGIRPAWANANEQIRITTPKEAIDNGVDFIVIGRPVTSPPNNISSARALKMIIEEIKTTSR